jgi:hypothetical protein
MRHAEERLAAEQRAVLGELQDRVAAGDEHVAVPQLADRAGRLALGQRREVARCLSRALYSSVLLVREPCTLNSISFAPRARSFQRSGTRKSRG